jgi:hypothetical protein
MFLKNLIFVHNLSRKVNIGKQTLFTLLKNIRHIQIAIGMNYSL